MSMLTEICQELRNWFDRNQTKWHGKFVIENGNLTSPCWNLDILDGQYYRIIGSVFNDGVHRKGDDALQDESFSGSIWAMAVPPSVIALAEDIEAWQEKYGAIDGTLMSPYSSESFGGYSYSKSSGGSRSNGYSDAGGVNWQSMFADRLNRWRKI